MNSNFVRVQIKLTAGQANKVMGLALARWPELASLRSAGQLQSINSGGQLRVAGVRGGQLPAGVTTNEMAHLVSTVLNA